MKQHLKNKRHAGAASGGMQSRPTGSQQSSHQSSHHQGTGVYRGSTTPSDSMDLLSSDTSSTGHTRRARGHKSSPGDGYTNANAKHNFRRSKELAYLRLHDDHAWGPNAHPPVHAIPIAGPPEDANYIAVDEERGTYQKLPENHGRSPCSHFSKFGWCPVAKICRHAHRGGRSITANLRASSLQLTYLTPSQLECLSVIDYT
jgi:hypothetical protein